MSRSLVAWHQRLADVVEGVRPRTQAQHLGGAFVHDRSVGGDKVVGTRRFGIAVVGAVARGVSRPGGTHLRLSVQLRVDYLDNLADQTVVNLAALEDAADIIDAITDSGAWRFEDTAIRVVGGETPTDIAVVAWEAIQGGQRLIIRFPVEVHR